MLQFDLGESKQITAIGSQAIDGGTEFIQTYLVWYSTDGNAWEKITDEESGDIFGGAGGGLPGGGINPDPEKVDNFNGQKLIKIQLIS